MTVHRARPVDVSALPSFWKPWVLFVLSILVFLATAARTEAMDFNVIGGHPRIFITPSSIPTLQNRAGSTHAATYAALKNWCDSNWGNLAAQKSRVMSGEIMIDAGELRYALIYLLGKIPGVTYSHSIAEYGAQAVNIMMSRLNDSWSYDSIQTTAIAYDWLFPLLTASQRQATVDWFQSIIGDAPTLTSPEVMRTGYRITSTPRCLYPALAFSGDGYKESLATTYLELVKGPWFMDLNAVFHEAGEDGGHSAGPEYAKGYYPTAYHIHQDFYALLTATTATIDQLFGPYSYVSGFPLWLLHNVQPGPPSTTNYSSRDVASLHKFGDMNSMAWNLANTDAALASTLRLLGAVALEKGDTKQAQWINWFIDSLLKASANTTWEIIFHDKSIGSLSPAQAGLSTCKPFGWKESTGTIDSYLDNPKAGLGEVYMRSSWNGMGATSSDTTYAVFKASPYYYFGHQHVDSLAFSIFKGEPLALASSGAYYYQYEGSRIDYYVAGSEGSSGFPHQWHYYERLGGNTLLIMDPAELIRTQPVEYPSDHIFKDGGQRKLYDGGPAWGKVTEGSVYDTGALLRYEDTSAYTYSSGDATKAYNSIIDGVQHVGPGASPKVSLVQRDFVYLKSADGSKDYFVVFDRVESTKPEFRKVFLLHTVGEPQLNGEVSTIYGGGSGGLFQSANSSYYKIVQSKSKMFMKSLLPLNARSYKMGGTATTSLAQSLDNTSGTVLAGAKIDIKVASTAALPAKPIVVIDGTHATYGEFKEAFMCDGKDDASNTLKSCLRGKRYYSKNYPATHATGSQVTQYYAWMYREADTGDWICHPFNFCIPNRETDWLNDTDEHGRWTLRIETTQNETLSNFLNVIRPTTDMAETEMAATALIDAGTMSGSVIKDPANQWIVLFSRSGALQNGVTYRADYTGSGNHLVTGLKTGIYDIYKNGVKILGRETSKQNTLSFETSGGKDFQIVKAGELPINQPPTAQATAQPTSGTAPLNVNFTGSGTDSDGSIVSYRWNFGDGQTSTQQNPSHTYAVAGTYSSTLTVTDDDGATGDNTVGIHVTSSVNNPPSASISASATNGTAPLLVNFTGTGTDSDGTIVSYLWNFGDGSTSTQKDPSHLFAAAGTYLTSLTVTDDKGVTGQASISITVSPGGTSFAYVIDDFTFYAVPELARPAKGVPYQDPNFNTTITRITDSPVDVPGSSYDYAQAGYPKSNIENADGTMLVVQSMKYPNFHVWNALPPYNKIKDIPSTILNPTDPDVRWDNSNPNLLYAHKGAAFYQWNVTTEEITLLHDFTNDIAGEVITAIAMNEEGDASDDRRYWAFTTMSSGVDHQTHIIVYDKVENRIVSRLDWGEGQFADGRNYWDEGVWPRARNSGGTLASLNFVGMSPSGEYVVGGAPPSWIYKRDFSSTRLIDTHGHVEVAVDAENKEVLVDSVIDASGTTDWARLSDLGTGEQYLLAPLGRVGGQHWSGNGHDKPGWAVYSTYFPAYPEVADEWDESSVFMVELARRPSQKYPNAGTNEPTRIWRLAHTHTMYKGYADCPFAKINKRGTKVFFGSGWHTSVYDTKASGAQYDVYQIDLPENWYQELSGGNTPPTAVISAAPLSGTAPLTVQFTGSGSDRDGSIVSYEWSFGDGAGSTQQSVSHTYNSKGTYQVSLTVNDDDGAKGRAFTAISVTQPPQPNDPPAAQASATPTHGPAPLAVAFAGSGTDSDGTIVSYAWDFGDGSTSTQQNPSHTYSAVGTFLATLKVTDNDGAQGTASVGITAETPQPPPTPDDTPTATISASITSGSAPLRVEFTASGQSSGGAIVSYIWSFSDGFIPFSTTTPIQTRTFEYIGEYIVSVTVADEAGAMGSASVAIRVTGDNSPPVFTSASAGPTSGTTPLTVTFSSNASDSDGIAYYYWSFGDGNYSVSQNATHSYNMPGNYIAVITVKDSLGAKSCRSFQITVSGDKTPPGPVKGFKMKISPQ